MLLIIKLIFPKAEWRWLWITVPVASWCIVNGRFLFDSYPGDGAARIFSLIIGWMYMLPVFGILSLAFSLVRRGLRRGR
jgi:hypothetical protein